MEKEIANEILSETEIGYDSISEKFSQTRKHFWRGLESIKSYTQRGDNVLDYGCGNGRLLELIGRVPDVQYYGLDVSQKFINIANNTHNEPNFHFDKIEPSQPSLAFEDNFFNTVYCIAVFHHFPSREYRCGVARQLYEKTKPGGRIVVTVWHLWQKKYFKNIMKNWFAKIKRQSDLDWNDCQISFKDNQGKRFDRFHHAFTKRELANLFEDAGFEIEKCGVPDGRNIVLVGKKKMDEEVFVQEG